MTTELPPIIVGVAIISDDGKVISMSRPARHHHVIDKMVNKLNYQPPIIGEQGFILDSGDYVNRVTARKIAEKNGQLLKTSLDLPELFSEDIW